MLPNNEKKEDCNTVNVTANGATVLAVDTFTVTKGTAQPLCAQ